MAITGTKAFTSGEILTANDVNQYLMRGVKVFSSTAVRDAAYGGAGEPVLEEGEAVFLSDTDLMQIYGGTAVGWINIGPSVFNTVTTITATNASWPVPTLKNPVVRVTAIGGGGGGGGKTGVAGGAGGTTTFNAGSAGTATASGGTGGLGGNVNTNGTAGKDGFVSANGGQEGAGGFDTAGPGLGGAITVAYFNLSGVSTVNVTIGAGGTGGVNAGGSGGNGGSGRVIVEYVG